MDKSEQKKAVEGTCLNMCSVSEMKWRERNGLLHIFERKTDVKDKQIADPDKVVKQFTRSAAGKSYTSPSDLRPSPVLLATMNYLVNEIIPKNIPYILVYDFVNDRIQGIRQDITIQMIEDLNTLVIFEKCVRFYLLSSYLLCEEPSTVFDMHLNNKQLTICLEKLMMLYSKFKNNNLCDFIAIYLSQKVVNSEIFHRALPLFKDYLSEPIVKLSIATCLAFTEGNFIKFFKLLKKLPLILSFSFFCLFNQVRLQAVRSMCIAFSSNVCKFPVETLNSWLSVPNKLYITELCKSQNINIDENYIYFNKKSFKCSEFYFLQKEIILDIKFENIPYSTIINKFS
ncbi:germinal-center associated nuclear protein [Parasteatoda tepidariorum]|uniref:germinal-center associated nuclear protein n=1 Tax=Parasteatoda tepidariorum TaxID=114398 RepID=UPI001C71C8B9|nr:germinal-center associated nuclear protein-like [Parasteatoda tepidariorum]